VEDEEKKRDRSGSRGRVFRNHDEGHTPGNLTPFCDFFRKMKNFFRNGRGNKQAIGLLFPQNLLCFLKTFRR